MSNIVPVVKVLEVDDRDIELRLEIDQETGSILHAENMTEVPSHNGALVGHTLQAVPVWFVWVLLGGDTRENREELIVAAEESQE